MKRFFALILALALCFCFAACANEPVEPPVPEDSGDGNLDEILGLLESEDYDAAIEMLEGLIEKALQG